VVRQHIEWLHKVGQRNTSKAQDKKDVKQGEGTWLFECRMSPLEARHKETPCPLHMAWQAHFATTREGNVKKAWLVAPTSHQQQRARKCEGAL